MDLKNVVLLECKEKAIYSCFEQQVMTLTYYLYKEHWKLFIENSIQCSDQDCENIEDIIVVNSHVIDMAEKHYGLIGENVLKDEELIFEEDVVYIIRMEVKDYPFTTNLEQQGDHHFIVYGTSQNGYLVNDNYYNVTDYILDYELFEKGEKRVYRIRRMPDFIPLTDYKEQIIQKLSCSYYDAIERVWKYIKEKNIYDYHSAPFFDRIQAIYSSIKKDILIVESNYPDDPYIKESLKILDEVSENIRKIWFATIKTHLKYGTMPKNKIDEKFDEISHYLAIEKRVKNEIINILTEQDSLKDKLHKQLLEYLEVEQVDDSRSVYEDHVGLAVMFLINHWEKENENLELDFLLYKDLKTYEEYKLMTYQNMLRSGL